MRKFLAIIVLFFPAFVAGCNDGCIFKSYTNSQGDELCGRFCPKKDAAGNEVVDSSGDPILEKDKTVNIVNCELPSSSTTGTTTSSSSTSGN